MPKVTKSTEEALQCIGFPRLQKLFLRNKYFLSILGHSSFIRLKLDGLKDSRCATTNIKLKLINRCTTTNKLETLLGIPHVNTIKKCEKMCERTTAGVQLIINLKQSTIYLQQYVS